MNRRKFLRGALSGAALTGAAALGADRLAEVVSPRLSAHADTKLQTVPSPLTTTGETPTSEQDITHYNNFYEFGVQKDLPAKNAGALPTRPWVVKVDGKVKKPKTIDIDTLLKLRPLEDRVYRHRCVEAWSMVIPWVGYSLSEFIKQCDPLPSAKYVQFLSYFDRKIEKWSDESTINWPYSEGLRMDEAMHPLTLLTFGLYGDMLPNQNGAPIRIAVPWKYGFKSGKSIVAVRFLDKQPSTTWNDHRAERVRLLLQCEPHRRPSPLEPEDRTPHRPALLRPAQNHPHVQRLWGPGRVTLHRHGPEEELLTKRS